MRQWRLVSRAASLGSFAVALLATACASEARSGTPTPPVTLEASATAGTAKLSSTPAPSPRLRARYLEQCAADVCRLVDRSEAFTDGDDGASVRRSWSPDRLRWAALVVLPAGHAALSVGEPATGAVRALLEVERQHDEVTPVWSPDGSMLALNHHWHPRLVAQKPSTSSLSTVDRVGRSVQRIPIPPAARAGHPTAASW